MEFEYDEDVLDIPMFTDINEMDDDWLQQLVEPDVDFLTGRTKKRASAPPQNDVTAGSSTSCVQQQQLVKPTEEYEPILVNDRWYTNWNLLKTSNTVAEIQKRMRNDVQKFHTREGETLFIKRDVLQRLDFDKISRTKNRKFVVNLPNKHEVKLFLLADGTVRWTQHKKKNKRNPKGKTTSETPVSSSTDEVIFVDECSVLTANIANKTAEAPKRKPVTNSTSDIVFVKEWSATNSTLTDNNTRLDDQAARTSKDRFIQHRKKKTIKIHKSNRQTM